MQAIADGLLIAGGLAAAFYCWVLSRRVRGLTDLDNGVGAAISALSRQVDEVKSSLDLAKAITGASRKELAELTARAEISAGRLELLLAALHEKGEVSPEAGDRLRKTAARRRGAEPAVAKIGAWEEAPGDEMVREKSADKAKGDIEDDTDVARGAGRKVEPEAASEPPKGWRGRGDVSPALKSVLKALDR